MKRKRKPIGAVVEIMLLILCVIVISLFLHSIGASGHKTENGTFETTLVVVNNLLTRTGVRYIFTNSFSTFQMMQPLILIILSLIAVSILEASGFLKHIFTPLKKINPKFVTAMVMFIGIISTFIGDLSYALLLPLAGILYKYIGRSSSLGILSMFIAITVGYGTGIIYNYQAYELGNITELAAGTLTEGYNYELLSNNFILLISTVALTIVGTIVLERLAKKFPRNEEKDNLNTSSKAMKYAGLSILASIFVFAYCIIPGLPHSGLLLDKTEPTYIGKLFGPGSPLSQGLVFVIIGTLMVGGLVYGKISRNIKNSDDYSKAFTKSFEGTGYVFVLLFFISLLYEILDWTNLSTVITTSIVDFIGSGRVSGLFLILVVFVSMVLISILIPSTIAKWGLIAPVYVPLLIRANISQSFTQTMFMAADSVGKLFSPIFVYFIVAIGFIYKYDKDSNISIFSTMKKIMPAIVILSLTWLVIIAGWYLIGLPIGINSTVSL